MTRNPSLALVLALLVTALGCTATRTREFTRESYVPAAERPAASRVFSKGPATVRAAVVRVLEGRGATFEQEDAFELVAALPFSGAAEVAASVDLGQVRRVVTRTERSYRSWSPLHVRCDACIVRDGKLVSQKTELVADEVRRLDPRLYRRIEARVRVGLEPFGSGTRVGLDLELAVSPAEPEGVLARSTGQLETALFAEIEAALPP